MNIVYCYIFFSTVTVLIHVLISTGMYMYPSMHTCTCTVTYYSSVLWHHRGRGSLGGTSLCGHTEHSLPWAPPSSLGHWCRARRLHSRASRTLHRSSGASDRYNWCLLSILSGPSWARTSRQQRIACSCREYQTQRDRSGRAAPVRWIRQSVGSGEWLPRSLWVCRSTSLS